MGVEQSQLTSTIAPSINPVRRWLKRFPVLVRLKRAIRRSIRFDSEILERLPLFAPFSAGPVHERADLAILAAGQTFPFLAHFCAKVAAHEVAVVQAENFCGDGPSRTRALRLKELFDRYGSDKGEYGYHLIYGPALSRGDSTSSLMEIGLGSNNEDVVSNMGRHGKPGASLRAFRDFLPNAHVYGADVDRRILFREERIRTFFVDQTKLESFDDLVTNSTDNFDLIIDDGLHAPNANIAVLIFAFGRLKLGGWVVIEDIHEAALPLWRVVAALVPAGHEPHLVQLYKDGGFAFAVQRTA